MTLAKATILSAVNSRLGLGISSIDTELLAAMQEVSALVPGILQKTGDVTVAINTTSIVLPTDIISNIAVLNASGVPLVPKPFQFVISKLRASTTAGVPQYYAFFDKKIYVYPVASAATVLTICYNHDDSNVENIGMPDEALECLTEGVCHKVELGKGVLGEMPKDVVTHYNFYQDQIKVLQARYKIYNVE
jgi:hypothetical protein